ncbi:MAG: EAL domain-containing protein [bacterium]|nr:EAL domain-containing protein [bacterium]
MRPPPHPWTLLRTDAVVLITVAGAVAALALGAIPAVADQPFWAEVGMELFFVLMTIAALLVGLTAVPARDERRFWRTIAIGFGVWATILVLYLTIPLSWWTATFDLTADSLFLVFYLCLLVAVDGRLDLRFERRVFDIGGRYRLPGTVIFSVGLFLYFVVVPAVLSPGLYKTWSPSLLLFLALDLYLALRLLVLSRVARSARWRRCFGLMAAVALLFVVADLVELLEILGVIPLDAGVVGAALRVLPPIGIVAVLRLRALPLAEPDADADEPGWTAVETLAQGAPFLGYAVFLPVLHFAAYRTQMFPELSRAVHENLVLGWLACLGAVSLVQYLDLKRSHDSLLDQRRLTEEKLWNLANFDQLTGLPNRVLFRDRFQHALKQARRHGRLLAVVFSDLDDFKRVNDSYGHAAGDELLRRVARRLVGCVRDSDTVARLGGDEFTILLEALDDVDHVEQLTGRLSRALAEPFEVDGTAVTLGSSLGVGIYPRDGEDVDTLLASADAAMYEGKSSRVSGRSNVRFFIAKEHGKWRDRLRLETELRRAVDESELVLDYQPIWSVGEARWSGLEALVRWQHPKRGLVMPGTFIPLAERTGLIDLVDGWVLQTACRQLAAWHRAGLGGLRLAVNLGAAHFHDTQLPRKIAEVVETLELPPSSLEIELTETMILQDLENAARVCEDLSAIGVRVAIDDFGAGQTSLRHLTRLSPAKLKIDRSLITEGAADPKAAAVVAAVVAMAHRMDLTVLAEGVETVDQRAFVEEQGCDEIQGFLLARPRPVEVITRMMKTSGASRAATGD